jgi:hypothetical protein
LAFLVAHEDKKWVVKATDDNELRVLQRLSRKMVKGVVQLLGAWTANAS